MILQELVRFYERKAQEGEMPRPGFSKQTVKYIMVINAQGKLMNVDTREVKDGKKLIVPLLEAPSIPDRSGKKAYEKPGFILDKLGYILGALPQVNKPEYTASYRALLEQCFQETQDKGLGSYLKFLDKVAQNEISVEALEPLLEAKPEPTVGIRLFEDESLYLWERPVLLSWYIERQQASSGDEVRELTENEVFGQCLISGLENVPLKRLHGKLGAKLIADNKAGIVDFNKPAFCSYGKQQSYNAPTSGFSERAYVAALQYLYNKESTQKMRMGGTVLAFWADGKTDFEQVFPSYFEGLDDSEPSGSFDEASAVRDAQGVFKAPHTGCLDLDVYRDDKTRFYVLGLSPNSARLSVRFWYQGSVYEAAERINQHLRDLAIANGPDEPDTLSLLSLLRTTAFEYKMNNINPRLQSEMMSAILQGAPYPVVLLQGVLRRVKVEHRVGYKRAALLKAYLNRYYRYYGTDQQPIGVTMDEQNMNPAYRLGRLFAILERLQEQALGSVNASIRDRYYNSASTTPRVVFGRLIRLSHHHLGKLNGGAKVWFSQLVGQALEPISPITNFPAYFTLEEQALFALGYYHQRQWFFTKRAPEGPIEATDLTAQIVTNNE